MRYLTRQISKSNLVSRWLNDPQMRNAYIQFAKAPINSAKRQQFAMALLVGFSEYDAEERKAENEKIEQEQRVAPEQRQ